MMSPDSRLRPYLALGLGVYPISISSEDSAGVQIRSIAATGISPGVGVDYKVGPAFGVSLEGRYHLVGGSQAEIGYKKVNYLEISIGFKFVPGTPYALNLLLAGGSSRVRAQALDPDSDFLPFRWIGRATKRLLGVRDGLSQAPLFLLDGTHLKVDVEQRDRASRQDR